ncbi:MAG TPA: VWA domain-containing protein [Pyrinomonadaceae bacterium]|nr:VWA domain-containing protein [Pyrinomonadaceae bacterium]
MQTEKRNSEVWSHWTKGSRRPQRFLPLIFCLPLAVFCFSPALAQDELPPPPAAIAHRDDEIETIRVDTELVDLNVSVFSRQPQRPIGELRREDFAVLENDTPEEISFFASTATPFDLVLLLDLSGSVKVDVVRKAARRFIEAARPSDRIGIVTFTEQYYVVSPLTTDRESLIKSVRKIDRAIGGTNFWDALHFVLKHIFGSPTASRRQAVVVMSDGVDNALPDIKGVGSTVTFDELLELVKTSDAIVIPIYLDTEREEVKRGRATPETFQIARRQLGELAGESGSLLYHARKVEDLRGVYEQVIRDLGTVYSIGYQPKNRRRDGSWRSVSVRLVNRPDLAARTRRGYYAR